MPTLARILTQLRDQACATPDQPQSANLPRGLRVSARLYKTQMHLSLSRQGTLPGIKELETILAHWPKNQGPRVIELDDSRHFVITLSFPAGAVLTQLPQPEQMELDLQPA